MINNLKRLSFKQLNWLGFPVLGLILLVSVFFSLEYFMDRLLARDAMVNGMRWAMNVEKNLGEVDQDFISGVNSEQANSVLSNITSLGQIYRYEFVNADGAVTVSFGSFHAGENGGTPMYHTHSHHSISSALRKTPLVQDMSMSEIVSEPHHIVNADNETHVGDDTHMDDEAMEAALAPQEPDETVMPDINGMGADMDTMDMPGSTSLGNELAGNAMMQMAAGQGGQDGMMMSVEGHQHQITLLNGDGRAAPAYSAMVEHPVAGADGSYGGMIKVFLDQSEKRALFQETFFWMAGILLAVLAIAFGVPVCYYLKSRNAHQKADEKAIYHSQHDGMTRLVNREKLIELVDDILDDVPELDGRFALHFLDVDNFKSINDNLGHAAGDELLRQLSDQMRGCVTGKHIIARIGGDEFAIFQTGISKKEEIKAFAAKIQAAVSGTFRVNGHDVASSTSVGTAISAAHGDSCSSLMKSADIALYWVKTNGRDGCALFEKSMKEARDSRLNLEMLIRKATENQEFELHYQPLFEGTSSDLCGFEALIRMRDEKGEFVRPDIFIPIAEEMGLMNEIGNWVLKEAMRVASGWPQNLQVAVNLSIRQFEKGDLLQKVMAALKESGLDPSRLELEITEGLIMHNTEWNLGQLHELKQAGISIAMDDFGTGYSSLGYLWKFPFDKIKIDQSFMHGLEGDQDTVTEIIKTIIALGHSLKMLVTAEGIETAGQLDMLQEMKCDLIQGYFLGRPTDVLGVQDILLENFQGKVGELKPTAKLKRSASA